MKPFLGCLCSLLICSCGESEAEKLARETREREAAQKQAWEEEKQLIQEGLDELKQGDGISMGDLLDTPDKGESPEPSATTQGSK